MSTARRPSKHAIDASSLGSFATTQLIGAQAYEVFPSGGVVGNVALKSLYVGYTDPSFTRKAAHPAEYGYLGPLIKAQACFGDLLWCCRHGIAMSRQSIVCLALVLSAGKPNTRVVGRFTECDAPLISAAA